MVKRSINKIYSSTNSADFDTSGNKLVEVSAPLIDYTHSSPTQNISNYYIKTIEL